MNFPLNGTELINLDDGEIEEIFNTIVKDIGSNRLQKPTVTMWAAILRTFEEAGFPQTVRQVFYKLVSYDVIAKSSNEYQKVVYHLLRMRRSRIIPYEWIADNTRWMRKPKSYNSLQDCLSINRETYRRAVWQDQAVHIEAWCEKDALAGVMFEVTGEWDIPLMVTRGFPSETFVYEAAQSLNSVERPIFIYYFGDHDPSGRAATENLKDKLRRFGVTFVFEQVAVLPSQIKAWCLPSRPTKRTDSRSKTWMGPSIELDAIPANQLRSLIRQVIEQHVYNYTLSKKRRIEQLERDSFLTVFENLGLD